MKTLKIKDYVFLAIISALYMVIYFITAFSSSVLGPFGHNISPGVFGLVGGTIIYFVAKKLGKMWQFTLLTIIIMGLFTLMGGGYLPWWICSILTAFLADLIVSRSSDFTVWKLALAFAIMQVGQTGGSLIPVMFFVDSYRQEWISRGQSPEFMDASIAVSQGGYALLTILIVFTLSFIGIYLGHFILRKHFDNQNM